jgi:hypothetical protein
VEQGGAVYASGRSGLQNLRDLLGIEPGALAHTEENVTYMTPLAEGAAFFPGSGGQYPLTVLGCQWLVQAAPAAETLATVTLPYTHPQAARFASIHSNPPGIATAHPAMILHRYGQGKTLWVAGCVEARGEKAQADAFAQGVDFLAEGRYAHRLEGPPAVEAVCFAPPDGILASFLNTQEALPPVEAHGVRLTVATQGRKAVKVLLLPEEAELPFTEAEGFVTFTAPAIGVFRMVKVVLGGGIS